MSNIHQILRSTEPISHTHSRNWQNLDQLMLEAASYARFWSLFRKSMGFLAGMYLSGIVILRISPQPALGWMVIGLSLIATIVQSKIFLPRFRRMQDVPVLIERLGADHRHYTFLFFSYQLLYEKRQQVNAQLIRNEGPRENLDRFAKASGRCLSEVRSFIGECALGIPCGRATMFRFTTAAEISAFNQKLWDYLAVDPQLEEAAV